MPKAWAKYKKSYRKDWESDPELKDWIAPVVGDDLKARCRYCSTVIRAHYSDLKDHGQTKKHKARCSPANSKINSYTVPVTPGSTTTSINDDQKRRELRIATYIACHTSINAVDELSDILQDEVGSFKMHRTKCSAIIKSVISDITIFSRGYKRRYW